jgi:hypothetical protein
MLPRSTREGRHGFSRQAAGRSKETAEGAGDSAKDTAADLGDKAQDAVGGEEGDSAVTESEQRLDDVRDQTMRDEGRMP